ncbi:hypothetical protein CYMTET_26929, partial [Cymbomonas tetramitiformis]
GMMELGCEYPAYPPFVAAGHNACLGHYTGAQDVLQEGDTLFLEIGGCFGRYHAAMMRTCFVGKVVPPELAEVAVEVARAMEVACRLMIPGALCGDVDAATRAILTRRGGDDFRPGWQNSLRTGYSIGIGFYTDWGEAELLVVEPGSSAILQAGMVLHLIPWVQLPERKQAVGLSDTVVVREGGAVTMFPKGSRVPREIALLRPTAPTEPYSPATARLVRGFFGSEPTPLVALPRCASALGLEGVLLKDESKRLGLQAFKVFGAAFAMACWVAQRLGVDIAECRDGLDGLRQAYFERFPETPTTFVTCTDGNHGRAVAWAAKMLGQHAVVYMPKGSAAARVAHVHANGGECTVTDLNYDQTVELAFAKAKEHGWVVLQDTTAEGYTEIPQWIMQGYTAMVDEALEQMEGAHPTHVLLQVGVGSMAGAVLGYLVERFKGLPGQRPIAVTLEPENAACAFASARRRDGKMATVEGDLETMIAGLACGVPSALGWPILAGHVDGGFCWLSDGLAANGMRALAREGVEAGECGGAAIGLLQRLMAPGCPRAKAVRERLGLGEASRVLVFNTEGATDPVNYAAQMKLPDVSPAETAFDFEPPLDDAPVLGAVQREMGSGTADDGANTAVWRHFPHTMAISPARIGLLVLQTDFVMEAEMRSLLAPLLQLPSDGTLPRGICVTARMPMKDRIEAATLSSIAGSVQGVVKQFFPFQAAERRAMEVLVFGCTSASLVIGEERVEALLAEEKPGATIVQVTVAIREALGALGARRLAVLTPYTEAVNRQVDAFLAAAEMEVIARGTLGCPGDYEANRVSPQEVQCAGVALVSSLPKGAVDALLICCTGLMASSVINRMEEKLDVPVITSNTATAWKVRHALGIEASHCLSLPHGGRLFQLGVENA